MEPESTPKSSMPHVPAACLLALAAGALLVARPRAHAQDLPTAAVVSAAPTDATLAPFSAAVERVERARLETLGAVRMSGAPALSLADLQLAVGCVGEGEACLRAIAEQLSVDLLFYSTVDRAGATRVAAIHLFDRRGQRPPSQAERQGAEEDLVEQVEPMLRELLDLPPLTPVEAAASGRAHHDAAPSAVPPHDPAMWIVSLSSFGVAAAAGVVGAVFGVMELDSAHAWATAPTDSRDAIDAAIAARDRASGQAMAANVAFVVAGVAAAAGATFLVLELTSGRPRAETGPTVSLSPAGAGVAMWGTW